MKILMKIPIGLAVFLTFTVTLVSTITIYPKKILQYCHFFNLSLWPTIITSMMPFVMHWSDWYDATDNQIRSNALQTSSRIKQGNVKGLLNKIKYLKENT